MTEAERLELCDLNLAEATREMARWHPDGELLERGGVLHAAGPDPFPVGFANSAQRIDRGTSAPAVLESAGRFFAERSRGYTVWTNAHADRDLEKAADAAGLQRLSESPGLVLEAPLPERGAAADATLRFVDDRAGAADFASVSARAYAGLGLPESVTARLFEHPERILQPHVLTVMAYGDGEALSAAMAILSHGIAGLYWVGTVPAGRRRGLAEACTRAVGNAAFARGARFVSLQASVPGEPIYRRMGYREITRYAWHVSLGAGR